MNLRKLRNEFDFDSNTRYAGERPKGVLSPLAPWLVLGAGAVAIFLVWNGGYIILVKAFAKAAPFLAKSLGVIK